MATTVRLKGSAMLPLVQALMNLTLWLKPGKLALRVGQIRHAVLPHAQALSDQLQKLEEAHPVEEWEDETKTRPKVDQTTGRVRRRDVDGFIEAQDDLMNSETEVVLVRCLTPEDMDRVEEMTRKVKDEAELPAVDFLAIAYVVNETASVVATNIEEDKKFLPSAETSGNGARPEVAAALE